MRSSGARRYPDNDPYGLQGTPRWVLGEPIVGKYAYIGSDGERHGVMRVRQHRDSSYRGVVVRDWDPLTNTKGSPRLSETCDIPADEIAWWDIRPASASDWTFDWRSYSGAANYIIKTTYSEDPDGFDRVECRWSFGPTGAELKLGEKRPLLVWGRAEAPYWHKLDQGGPVVKAHKGSGTPGRKFAISFTAREPDGWASFYVRVYRRKSLLASVIYEVELPIGMSTKLKARGALAKGQSSHLRWCVTAFDASRNKRSDCARLITPRGR